MKVMLINLLFLLSFSAFAQSVEEDCDTTPAIVKQLNEAVKQASDSCPNSSKLEDLCYSVRNKLKEPTPLGKYRFSYQKKLLEAACVQVGVDNDEVTKTKISNMWRQLEDRMICNSPSFDVENGNVIKFAVAVNFDEFIFDISRWNINLNRVDPSDNRTVLDYIKKVIEENRGNTVEPKLRGYYDRLRRAGAKHKSEL